jgi:hypothetical protein
VAGYPAVVDRDGVSPELSSDIEELNRRRADIAVGWATVEAHNRRRRRSYGLVGTASVAGLTIAVTAAGLVPVYLSEHGMLAGGTLNWLVPVGMLGAMAVGAGLYIWWYVAAGGPAAPPPGSAGRRPSRRRWPAPTGKPGGSAWPATPGRGWSTCGPRRRRPDGGR